MKRTMEFDVYNQYTGDVQFTADIYCDENDTHSKKLKLAVLWAIKKGVKFVGADLEGLHFTSAGFKGVNLAGVSFKGARLVGANFDSANLQYANFEGADLRESKFENANLHGVNFNSADLGGADFQDADLIGVRLVGTHIKRTNFAGVKGLDGFICFGPVGDTLRIGTAKLLNGKVTVFLGCWRGNLEETCKQIQAKYGPDSAYESLVRAAVTVMMETAWNKPNVKVI